MSIANIVVVEIFVIDYINRMLIEHIVIDYKQIESIIVVDM